MSEYSLYIYYFYKIGNGFGCIAVITLIVAIVLGGTNIAQSLDDKKPIRLAPLTLTFFIISLISMLIALTSPSQNEMRDLFNIQTNSFRNPPSK